MSTPTSPDKVQVNLYLSEEDNDWLDDLKKNVKISKSDMAHLMCLYFRRFNEDEIQAMIDNIRLTGGPV